MYVYKNASKYQKLKKLKLGVVCHAKFATKTNEMQN